MALTYQEVEAACSILEQQGTKLSTRNVREYVGSGSLTTISKYLQKRSEQNDPSVQQDGTAIPRLGCNKESKRTPVHHGVQEISTQEEQKYHAHPRKQNIQGWVMAVCTAPILLVCLVLSYYFQVEAFSELVVAPTETILGLPFAQVSAGFLEAALVLLSMLGFLASTRSTQVMAWLLFGAIGIGSGALMVLNQERKKLASTAPIELLEDNQEITLFRQAFARKKASWELLSQQLDMGNKKSAAYKGESGNIRRVEKSMAQLDSEMDILRGEIARLTSDRREYLAQRRSSPIESRVSFINEGIRILLLILTAFLVHVLLTCIGPARAFNTGQQDSSVRKLPRFNTTLLAIRRLLQGISIKKITVNTNGSIL